MGLFNRSDIILFTAKGVKRLYQFFILNFCILLFQIIVFVIILLGYTTGTLTGLIYSIFTSTIFVALILTLEIFIIIWLFWAFVDLVNGRKEIDKQHEISVIIASAFLIPSIFLYLIQLVLSKGLVISTAAFYINPTGNLASILMQGSLLLTISFVIPILMGFALFLFIHKLSVTTEKVPLMFACGLLVTSPFTMYITALIAYFLFFMVYRSVYNKLKNSKFKPTDNAPCPFCNKNIPIESKECGYCGAKFKENPDMELDPRLRLDLPKKEPNVPYGYTPVKGPTEEQKKRLFKIIGAIIAIIVIVAVIALILG